MSSGISATGFKDIRLWIFACQPTHNFVYLAEVGPSLVDGCLLATPYTFITDGCAVGHLDIWQLLCRCMQEITAETVIAYITHDDRPKCPIVSSASSRHGAKQRGSLLLFGSWCIAQAITKQAWTRILKSLLGTSEREYLASPAW